MKILLQPKSSSSCGQHCVAMITNKKIESVIKIFGTNKATNTREVKKALEHYKFKVAKRLERTAKNKILPNLCILHIKFSNQRIGHWVVYYNRIVYDPTRGKYNIDEIPYKYGKIVSFLTINK